MPLRAFILDLDGTLVDTNPYHVESFRRAFRDHGHESDEAAIAAQVGKGADKVVAALLDVNETEAEVLRDAAKRHFHHLVETHRIELFPQATDLIQALKGRGLKLAIATAAASADLDAIFQSAGTDLRTYVDAVTTSSDVENSKPDADVVHAALDKLGVEAAEAVMVGDTRYDFEAAGQAGVGGIGVATWVYDQDTLRAAGARAAYADVADLLAHLDEALAGAGA